MRCSTLLSASSISAALSPHSASMLTCTHAPTRQCACRFCLHVRCLDTQQVPRCLDASRRTKTCLLRRSLAAVSNRVPHSAGNTCPSRLSHTPGEPSAGSNDLGDLKVLTVATPSMLKITPTPPDFSTVHCSMVTLPPVQPSPMQRPSASPLPCHSGCDESRNDDAKRPTPSHTKTHSHAPFILRW